MASNKRHKATGVFVVVCIVTLGGGIWWVMKTNNSPAIGHIQAVKTIAMQSAQTDDIPQTFSGTYIDLSYPPSYHIVPMQLTGNRLEAIELAGKKHQQLIISISLAPSSLGEDSSVRLRRLSPSIYKEESWHLGDDTGLVFTNISSGFEKTAFVIHKNYEAAITFSDPLGQDQANDFDAITHNITWHE